MSAIVVLLLICNSRVVAAGRETGLDKTSQQEGRFGQPSKTSIGAAGQCRRPVAPALSKSRGVAVLVALQLADEFQGRGSQAGNDGVDVLDGECIRSARRRRARLEAELRRARPMAGWRIRRWIETMQ